MTEQPDRFTDDELRALLRRVITLIHDGSPSSPEAVARIEAAIRARNDRR